MTSPGRFTFGMRTWFVAVALCCVWLAALARFPTPLSVVVVLYCPALAAGVWCLVGFQTVQRRPGRAWQTIALALGTIGIMLSLAGGIVGGLLLWHAAQNRW